jgi:hypothetical protein
MVRVTTPANPTDDPADARALRGYADGLLAAVVAALPGWVERSVVDRHGQWAGTAPPATVRDDARYAGEDAVASVEPALRALLSLDVDEQRTNPLAIIRVAVRHPTAVLRAAGVPPVERDAHAERLFPEDVYDLSPAAFADIDESVHEPGLLWGAAKAHVILRRRRQG